MSVIIPHLRRRWDPITNQLVPVLNLDSATEFGELVVLVDGGSIEAAMTALHDQAPQVERGDWILCTGDIAILAYVIHQSLTHHGNAKLLRWDRNQRDYNTQELIA